MRETAVKVGEDEMRLRRHFIGNASGIIKAKSFDQLLATRSDGRNLDVGRDGGENAVLSSFVVFVSGGAHCIPLDLVPVDCDVTARHSVSASSASEG